YGVAYELIDRAAGSGYSYTEFYTPTVGWTPSFGAFITEAYSINGVTQQIAQFRGANSNYGEDFSGNLVCDVYSNCFSPYTLYNNNWYQESFLAQSDPSLHGYNILTGISANDITMNWQSSYFNANYMCTEYGADCGV
ncbi:MAG: hypothetical protein ACREBQ_05220, partial [Nitrososphaerales archaeon]